MSFRTDVYIHQDTDDTKLDKILKQGAHLMAKFEDLQADVDKLKTDVSARLDALAQTIADLKAQLTAGSPVTQAQLDAIDAEVKAIDDSLTPPATA